MYNYRCDGDCKGAHTHTLIHTEPVKSPPDWMRVTFLIQRILLECFIIFLEKCVTSRSLKWKGWLCVGISPHIKFQKQGKGWHTFMVTAKLNLCTFFHFQICKIVTHEYDMICTEIWPYYLLRRTPESAHHRRKLRVPSVLYTSCLPSSCTPHRTPTENRRHSFSFGINKYGWSTFIDCCVISHTSLSTAKAIDTATNGNLWRSSFMCIRSECVWLRSLSYPVHLWIGILKEAFHKWW